MIYDFDDYESPISMEIRKVTEKIAEERDNQILAAIQEECQIKIDKFELMRALNYDRDQYKKGFEDAKKKFERPKGKWIEFDEVYRRFTCSVCKRQMFLIQVGEFCLACGADMREDEKDD